MVNKNFIIFLFIFLFHPFLVYSQSAMRGEENYRIDIRYIQRLTWTGDKYALHYEVVIEKFENNQFLVFLKDFTENEYIEVTLPPGKYRYQVIPYDFLNSPIPVTEWVEFEVLQAVNENQEQEKTFVKLNQFDIYIGAVYMPLLPLYNDNEFFFGEDMSLIGAGLRLGVVSSKQSFVSPGLELLTSWRIYEITQAITIDINFLSQIRLMNRRTAFNFRIGAGVSLLSDIPPVSTTGQFSLHANIGLSFLVLILPKMYLELGADYSQFFTLDNFGFFRPWIGIGARL